MARYSSTRQTSKFIDALADELKSSGLSGIDASFALTWVESNFEPDEVFEVEVLDDWAKQNGWKRDDDEE